MFKHLLETSETGKGQNLESSIHQAWGHLEG